MLFTTALLKINPPRSYIPYATALVSGIIFVYDKSVPSFRSQIKMSVFFHFSHRDHNWFWIPVVGPHLGAILGAWLYMIFVGAHTGDPVADDDTKMDNAGKSTSVCVGVF